MDSSPQIQRAYRDDVHAGVATPLLPVKEDLLTAQPRWSKKSNRRRNFVCAAIVMSTILAIYLLLCAAFIIGNDMVGLIFEPTQALTDGIRSLSVCA